MPSRRSVLAALIAGIGGALSGCSFASSDGESPTPDGETPATQPLTSTATPAPTATLMPTAIFTPAGTAENTASSTTASPPTSTRSPVPTAAAPTQTPTASTVPTPIVPDGTQIATVAGEDLREYDEFGHSVATDGNTLFVAAPGDSHPDLEDASGSAYVFDRVDGEWTQRAKLVPDPEALQFDYQLGTALSVSGDRAVVGALQHVGPHRIPKGGAFVYERADGEWQRVAVLRSGADPEYDGFGRSVDLDDDRILVGAPHGQHADGTQTGFAYVYTAEDGHSATDTADRSASDRSTDERAAPADTWTQRATLASPDGGRNDYFGYSVALDGETALVGAYNFETPESDNIGKAYLFERADGEWGHRTTLTPTADHDHEDYFGSSVALDGTTALVASWGDDDPNGFYAGSAYAFERIDGRWIMDTKLVSDDGERKDVFGSSIALEGDTALVGAEHDDENTGSAYLFEPENGEWAQQTKLLPDEGNGSDLFGTSVALAGGRGFVGAIYEGSGGTDKTGAVYVFSA